MKGKHSAIIDRKQESVIPNGIRFQGFWAGKEWISIFFEIYVWKPFKS